MVEDYGSGSVGGDSGAGSPGADSGAGSPTSQTPEASVPTLPLPGDGPIQVLVPRGGGAGVITDSTFQDFDGLLMLYSDEGGYELIARRSVGLWPSVGPYRVRLTRNAKTYPLSSEGCFGGVPGLRLDCYANPSRRAIRFVLPSLPAGIYGILITKGEAVVASSAAVLKVVRRPRAWPTAYTMKAAMGDFGRRAAGTLDVRAEPEATDDNRPPYVPWQAVIHALARSLREVSGSPTTRLRGDHDAGATSLELETVLGFPSRGWLWADGESLEYSARAVDDRRLTLALPLQDGLPGNTPIVFDARKSFHPGIYREPDPEIL